MRCRPSCARRSIAAGRATAIALRPDLERAFDRAAVRTKRQAIVFQFPAQGAHLSPVAIGLLQEAAIAAGVSLSSLSPADLAGLINAVPVELTGMAPIARAISTAGGISFDELDADFMIQRLPGVFAAGEMLDWEAPTGGYLLQASFATGAAAGRGVLKWLHRRIGARSDARISQRRRLGRALRAPHDERSPQLPPRRDRQHADDLVAAHHHYFVHHVDDDADMVGHDADDVADIGRVLLRARSRKPCSSAKRAILASGCSRIRPWPSSPPPVSEVSVFEPASRMPRSGPARLTTVE